MNTVYIYVKQDEELGEIIEKIRATKDKDIVLVVPSETRSLSHQIHLEILKKEIDSLKKNVYISTDDEKIATLARKVGHQIFLMETEPLEAQVIDIRPPKKIKIIKETIPPPVTSFDAETGKIKKKFFPPLKSLLGYSITLFFIIFIGFVFWQFFQSKAEVLIEIEKTTIDINNLIVLKDGLLKPDIENKILPAKYVKIELNETQSITTTGPIFTSQNPLLKVVFFNFSDQEIPIVSGTRLEYEGNIFRTTKRIVIPPQKDGVPGEVEVTAIPDKIIQPNLTINSATSLKIPALEGKRNNEGRLWSDVIKVETAENYDLSSLAKTGSVAPEDITNVKLALERSLKDNISMKIRLEYPEYFYVYDPSFVKVEVKNVSNQVGDRVDKIYATGKATYETLIASKKEFDNFVKGLIDKEILAQDKKLIIDKINLDTIEVIDFDFNSKTMTVGIKGKAILMPDIDPEIIKKDITNKSIEDVDRYFKNIAGVKKVTIRIFPNWLEKLPQNPQKIKVRII